MVNNELAKITSKNSSEVQYFNIKRIIPQNHPSLKALMFYDEIMRMNEPIFGLIDYKA